MEKVMYENGYKVLKHPCHEEIWTPDMEARRIVLETSVESTGAV